MIVRSETAASIDLGLSIASPIPIFTTTLVMRGTCIMFLRSNALRRAGTTSMLYFSCILFITITPRLINQRLTVFADSTRPIFIALNCNTCRLTAFRAYEHHIRDVDRSFELDPARINIATCLGLHLLLMLGANIHTLDNNTTILQQHIDDFPALAFIFQAATNDFDGIAFTNLDSHT